VTRRTFALGLGLVSLVAAVGWSALVKAPPADPDAGPALFRVEPGEGFASVAARLEADGLVVSAGRFRVLARLRSEDRSIHAGTYELARGADPRDLLRLLSEGKVRLRRFTIPEGRRLADLALDAEQALGIPAAEVLTAASDPDRIERLGARTETLEGFLFPETYLLPDGATAGDLVDAATRRFEEVWESLRAPARFGLDRHAVVTLASIVEAETPLAKEKPRVAAVYRNRLERGMRLQADPTVRYGLGRFEGRLYYKHLDIDTPYNTYRRDGLPPGPIGAPGRAALDAVLRPQKPCEDLYFVASGDGGHVFSRTKAEHDRAVAAARKRRDAAQGSR
jgi:UPF0755 protein